MSMHEILRELSKRVYFEQVISFYSCKEIAQMINQSVSNTHKALKPLIEEGIIIENKLPIGRRTYQLSRQYYNETTGKANCKRIEANDSL